MVERGGLRESLEVFAGETSRLIKLVAIRVVLVRTSTLIEAWGLVLRYHVYLADARQVASAMHVKAVAFYAEKRAGRYRAA